MAYAVNRMVLRLEFFLCNSNSLDGKQGVLRTAVAFLADAGLLAPQVAVDRVTLGHLVVAIALGETHAAAVGKLAQQGEHLPLDVRGRLLAWVAEIDLVL